ncbi:MAG TPA: 2-hydroxyacyl-CoA dehydratase family protein [Desulfobacteraceae bacterium]|nr:2-hydroxyacyl-CoA dehydratase family protein [Desulfobacteraceae bacterium]
MEAYEPFYRAASDPAGVAEQVKANQRETMGYFCSYAPEELIYAAGFHPMRLFSRQGKRLLAESHLQSYCCSLVRNLLEQALSGRLAFLSGAVFPHTCDSMQRLSDIWRLNTNFAFFSNVVMPVKLNSGSSFRYMADVLASFKKELETHTGRAITLESLEEAVGKFNRIRELLAGIYDARSQHPGIISGADLHALVKGAMIMDRDALPDLLENVLANLQTSTEPRADKAPRIVVSGSVCDVPEIYTIIEQAGGVVVGDDLCTGQRWFDGRMDPEDDPMNALTRRYAKRLICPAKHTSPTARGEGLVELVGKNRAQGVVFLFLKFCDPHAFDYPYLKECLEEQGIKVLLLEMDDLSSGSGQLATRLETFVQMM